MRFLTPNHSKQPAPINRLAMDRLNALTDGILGFAMTLLVLNIDIPPGHNFSEDGLLAFFAGIEHDLLIYTASFFLIARYWVEHHLIFHFIRYVSRGLVWLNFLFIFFVTMLPFATRLKGIYEHDAIVAVLFGLVHIACWVALFLIWQYAVSHPALLDKKVDPAIERTIKLRLMMGPAVISIAIVLSYVNMRLGTIAFLSVPVFYLFQPRVDLHAGAEVAAEEMER